MNTKQHQLLELWKSDCRILTRAHYDASTQCEKKHVMLGVPAAILSAVVGTSVFAALGEAPTALAQLAVGFTSIAVTGLTSLQTFLRYAEQSGKHLETAAAFAALAQEIEQTLVCPLATDEELTKWMTSVRERWAALRREKLAISDQVIDKHREKEKTRECQPVSIQPATELSSLSAWQPQLGLGY
jgi:hypothetical protein